MGRRSRHSAKTGDQSLYNSRAASVPVRRDESDDDAVHNEVERFHNRREEEEYLRLEDGDGAGDEDSSADDGITKGREGVFDLGIEGSSDEEEDEDDASEDEDGDAAARAETRRAAKIAEGFASSSSDDDGDSDAEGDGDARSRLLNWGDKKQSYYHGDTADLEIGQDVEDAYLEEAAGREVEKARLEALDDADFRLDDDDDEDECDEDAASGRNTGRALDGRKKREDDNEMETLPSAQRSAPLSTLSKKDKLKRLQARHPELLPLVRHFSHPLRELHDTTLVAAGALFKNGVAKGVQEAKAVGATPAGLRYLLTKCMLQASTALNVALYLLLKDECDDDIRHHPVMDRLNQLTELGDKLQEDVEGQTPGLREQMRSLVKAVALMDGGELSSSDSDSDSEGDDGNDSSELQDAGTQAAEASVEHLAPGDNEESSSESDEDGEDAQDVVRRRIMTEAKFALRTEDIERDGSNNSKSQKQRLEKLTAYDYGDETKDVSDKALAASQKLASTMNSIVQKSNSKGKRKTPETTEVEGDDDYDQIQRGLSMMDEELGKVSDDNDEMSGSENGGDGLGDSDQDEFYQIIQRKSQAKKKAKKEMYAVAPKYPRLDGEVTGERAIGKTILKNRGLVAHKAKINRNPRVKKREQYRKALIKRKGAVRELRTGEGHAYGGESTGIKSGLSRSRKLSGK